MYVKPWCINTLSFHQVKLNFCLQSDLFLWEYNNVLCVWERIYLLLVCNLYVKMCVLFKTENNVLRWKFILLPIILVPVNISINCLQLLLLKCDKMTFICSCKAVSKFSLSWIFFLSFFFSLLDMAAKLLAERITFPRFADFYQIESYEFLLILDTSEKLWACLCYRTGVRNFFILSK